MLHLFVFCFFFSYQSMLLIFYLDIKELLHKIFFFKYYISHYFFYFFKIISGRVCVRVGGAVLRSDQAADKLVGLVAFRNMAAMLFHKYYMLNILLLCWVPVLQHLLEGQMCICLQSWVLQQLLCFVVKNRIPMIKELFLNCHIRKKKNPHGSQVHKLKMNLFITKWNTNRHNTSKIQSSPVTPSASWTNNILDFAPLKT